MNNETKIYQVKLRGGDTVKVVAPIGASKELVFDMAMSGQRSPSADVVASAPGAVGRGVLGATMMLPELANAAAAGPQLLGRGLANPMMEAGKSMGLIPEDVRPVPQNVEPWKPFYSSQDAINALPEKLQPYEPKTKEGKIAAPIMEMGATLLTPAAWQKLFSGKPNAVLNGIMNRSPEQLNEASQAMRQDISNKYTELRNMGVVLTRQKQGKVVSDIGKALNEGGKMNPDLHTNTASVYNQFMKYAKNNRLDMQELENYRRLFREADVSSYVSKPSDAERARRAISKIDEIMDTLKSKDVASINKGSAENYGKLVRDARKAAQTRSKFDTVSNIVVRSEGDPNYIKREMAKLVGKKQGLRGWTNTEQQYAKEAGRMTATEGVLKQAGKFGFDLGTARAGTGNTFLPFGSMGAGALAGDPSLGLIIAGGGTAARQGQKWLARGKIENLLREIEGLNPPVKTPYAKISPYNYGVLTQGLLSLENGGGNQ